MYSTSFRGYFSSLKKVILGRVPGSCSRQGKGRGGRKDGGESQTMGGGGAYPFQQGRRHLSADSSGSTT